MSQAGFINKQVKFMDGVAGLVLLWLGLIWLYVFLTVRQVRYYWRYPVFLIWGAATVFTAIFVGSFSGNFDHTLAAACRQYFFDQFLDAVNHTPDFSSTLQQMQQKINDGEFAGHLDRIAYPLPFPWLAALGWSALPALIGAEFIRQKKLKITVILLCSALSVGLISYYSGMRVFSVFSKGHAGMICKSESEMIRYFASCTPPELDQAQIAAAVRDYIAEDNYFCHNEPYQSLEVKLWPELKKQQDETAAASPGR